MKNLVLAIGLALAAGQSWGAYLYFQIPTSPVIGREFDFASVVAVGEDEAITYLTSVGGGDIFDPGHGVGDAIDLVQLGDPAAFSYYIELYNADFQVVAFSEKRSYSDLVTGNYISEGYEHDPTAYWHGEGYSVPEPTSGMMLLLGMGLLGLRRRRMKEVA